MRLKSAKNSALSESRFKKMGLKTLPPAIKVKPGITEFIYHKTQPEIYKVTTSSRIYFHFKCKNCCGEFTSQLRSMISTNKNCPYCDNRKVLSGFNDLKTKQPELTKEYLETNRIKASEILHTSNTKVEWICSKCKNIFKMSPSSRVREKQNCPKCNGWRGSVSKKTIKELYGENLKDWDYNKNTVDPNTAYWSSDKYWFICPKGHSYEKTLSKIKLTNCGVCHGKQVLIGSNDFKSNASLELLDEWDSVKNKKGPEEYTIGSNKRAWWVCKHGHSFLMEVGRRYSRGDKCPDCSNIKYSSFGEIELCQYIKQLGYTVIERDRNIIKPNELDIYVPKAKTAIEYNGDYWHSDEALIQNKGKTAKAYHLEKLNKCKKKDITLLFVWESDWNNNREGVKAALILYFDKGVIDPILSKLEGNLK